MSVIDKCLMAQLSLTLVGDLAALFPITGSMVQSNIVHVHTCCCSIDAKSNGGHGLPFKNFYHNGPQTFSSNNSNSNNVTSDCIYEVGANSSN